MSYFVQLLYELFIIVILVGCLPVVIIVALLIFGLTGLPVIYRQKRVGLHGKPFTMYKFRTMIIGAENLQKRYRILNEADGPVFKINGPRFAKSAGF